MKFLTTPLNSEISICHVAGISNKKHFLSKFSVIPEIFKGNYRKFEFENVMVGIFRYVSVLGKNRKIHKVNERLH